MPPYNYNINPTSRGGQGPFGRVPGVISMPRPDLDLAAQYPNLGRTNAALSRNILAGLEGQLSPATLNALQDTNAAWAVGAGMPAVTPGSLSTNRLARNIGRTAEDTAAAAAARYASIIPTVSGTQTVRPELQYEIAHQNAINSSAPDPSAAQSYAQQLYQRYLGGLAGGGGSGPQGGTYRPIERPDAATGGTLVGHSLGTGYYSGGQYITGDPAGGTGGYTYTGGYGGGGYDEPYMDDEGFDLGAGYMYYAPPDYAGGPNDYGSFAGDLNIDVGGGGDFGDFDF